MIFICAIIKNEHRFIEEWVGHHFRLGFDQIVLYDNDSDHNYDKELGELKGIEIKPWRGSKEFRQRAAYEDFQLLHQWTEHDWCLFIDADEFLHLQKHNTVQELVEDYQEFAGVVLSWQCFGANGCIRRPNMSVRRAYTKPAALIRDNHNFKSFVRLNEISFWNDVHRITPRERKLVNVRREQVVGSNVEQVLEVAWIDHYITKSWQDYVARLKRGNISYGIRTPDHFFAYNPDMEHLIGQLTVDLNFDEFPTLYNKKQKEAIEQEEKLNDVADKLEELAQTGNDEVFTQFCSIELIDLGYWYLGRVKAEDKEALFPKYLDLMKKQIAAFSKIPRNTERYHQVIINNLISTPFERIIV